MQYERASSLPELLWKQKKKKRSKNERLFTLWEQENPVLHGLNAVVVPCSLVKFKTEPSFVVQLKMWDRSYSFDNRNVLAFCENMNTTLALASARKQQKKKTRYFFW